VIFFFSLKIQLFCPIAGFALLSAPKKPFHHITFQFWQHGRNVRRAVGNDIKSIFSQNIKQRYGGWVSRLNTDDSMRGLYEVHIFSKSYDIKVDPKFDVLWAYMSELDVSAENVSIGLMTEVEADPGFQYRFVLDFKEDSPNDWSQRDNISETESLFSIESVQDLV
jgi:hypothetical protein